MTFTPGDKRPKYGGRKKGSTNKKTQEFQDILDAMKFSPAREAIKSLRLVDDPIKHAELCIKLMEFIYPKRKAIDVSSEDGSLLTATDLFAALEKYDEKG